MNRAVCSTCYAVSVIKESPAGRKWLAVTYALSAGAPAWLVSHARDLGFGGPQRRHSRRGNSCLEQEAATTTTVAPLPCLQGTTTTSSHLPPPS